MVKKITVRRNQQYNDDSYSFDIHVKMGQNVLVKWSILT